MKKLEQLWQTLTEAERVALVVMADVLVNRQAIAENIRVANVSAGPVGNINRGLTQLDSSVLRPEADRYLEQFLSENPITGFAELYHKLMAKI